MQKAFVLLDVRHNWLSDITIKLEPQIGNAPFSVIDLITRRGDNGHNFEKTIISSTCSKSLPNTSAGAPFEDCYRPEPPYDSLAGLNGKNPVGTWILKASDIDTSVYGTVNSWSAIMCVVP